MAKGFRQWLYFYGRGELYPEFEAVAFKLKDGEVSEIVETEAGFHIIQLIERRGDYVNVRHLLLTPKVSPESLMKARAELDSVARLIRAGELSFEQAVEKFSDQPAKLSSGLILNPYTGGTKFEASQLDPQVSFLVEKMSVGELSDPVPMKTEDGKDAFRLLKVTSKTEPHQANLKEDYNRIQDWALQQKKQKAIELWIRNKSKNAFVSIISEYRDCPFEFDWKSLHKTNSDQAN
jgi:peptidyl-prolyl cis-trans isomerase SurA